MCGLLGRLQFYSICLFVTYIYHAYIFIGCIWCVYSCIYTGSGSHAEGKDRLLYNHYASIYNNIETSYYIIMHSKKVQTHTCTWIYPWWKPLISFILIFLATAGQCVQWNLYSIQTLSFDVWQNIHSWLWYTYQTAGVCTYMYTRLACHCLLEIIYTLLD